MRGHRTIWTDAMLERLQTEYPVRYNRDLARDLGVSLRTLIRKARELGIEKEPGFWDGVEEGKQAMEKQMMEGAVDAEIVKDIHNLLHVKSGPLPMPTKHRFGDRVKILILKDDEN